MSKEQRKVLLHGFQSVTSLSLSGDFVSSNQSFELISSFPRLLQLHLSSSLHAVIQMEYSTGHTKRVCLDHLSIIGSTAWSLLAPHIDSEIHTSKLTLMNLPFPSGFSFQNTVANLYNMIGSSLEQLTLEIPNSHPGEGESGIVVCTKSILMLLNQDIFFLNYWISQRTLTCVLYISLLPDISFSLHRCMMVVFGLPYLAMSTAFRAILSDILPGWFLGK
jgi:hypothetical protein